MSGELRATIYRKVVGLKEGEPTLGELQVHDETVSTLEKPWLNNDRRVSCIPEGVYKVTKEMHHKFGKVFRLHGVPNRSGILIHIFNYERQSLGCISPGIDQTDLDGDGHIDNVSSTKAMNLIWEYDITEIEIKTV